VMADRREVGARIMPNGAPQIAACASQLLRGRT
jgi:hypothetical protein